MVQLDIVCDSQLQLFLFYWIEGGYLEDASQGLTFLLSESRKWKVESGKWKAEKQDPYRYPLYIQEEMLDSQLQLILFYQIEGGNSSVKYGV